MASTDPGESRRKRERFDEFCSNLNLDAKTGEIAWQSYERISVNYTLEGDDLHWLACALYVACRNSVLPTVGNGTVEGNCISLTVLLRTAKLSVIQFFNKMKKWSDMANLPQQFRDKVDRLERNFAVSTVIFKKYKPIFLDIFKSAVDETPKVPRGRKQRRLPCTSSDVFKFCWTLFVSVKGNFPAISDDLVNSYHLLLCCLDLIFANVVLANRRDLLNVSFPGLPENFNSRDYRVPPEAPCTIDRLCELHDGLVIEAKGIKQHWWRPHVEKLFKKKILRGTEEKLSALLDVQNFELNSKSINKKYEEYVLTRGDFDERIFLGEDADEEIGTPAKLEAIALDSGSITEKMSAKRKSTSQQLDRVHVKSLAPSTPLTGRRYLKEKDPTVTPVSTATQTVSRLQALLAGRKVAPSEELTAIFSECKENPSESIAKRVKEMGEVFVQKYTQPSGDESGSHIDFAKRRLTLAASLYYKCLESIMKSEKKRKQGKVDLACLLEHDMFHRSLFACCLEVIIFAYNSQRTFPWVIECCDIPAFHYYKVIELLLRAEEGLSRDIVKHLNHVEEDILQEHAWRNESPLWEALKESGEGAPSCEDVSLPNQTDKPGVSLSRLASPVPLHPRVRQLVTTAAEPGIVKKDLLQSPTSTSARDRFSSPSPGSGAKRRLFSLTPAEGNEASSGTPESGEASKPSESSASAALKAVAEKASAGVATSSATSSGTTSGTGKPPQIRLATVPSHRTNIPTQTLTVAVHSVKDKDGIVRYIASPVKTVKILTTTVSSPSKSPVKIKIGTEQILPSTSGETQTSAPPPKPKKTGSLGLFFRKVYHLINVRLLDLCTRLNIEEDLRRKIWTCMEQSIVKHVELMKDRHLDQLIMCAIYVVCKVTKKDQQFQEIMKCYRRQPQAASHVYRSVLLRSRKRHSSDESSDSSQNGSSQEGSPDAEKKETRINRNPHLIRSASTLPGNLSNSCPPTPTKMAGTGSTFEDEDRGDLIMFYNSVYVKKMQDYALRFSPPSEGSTDLSSAPTLSPMPVVRPHQTSPRKVSSRHQVYISTHNDSTLHSPTKGNMMYYIQKSPAKSLKDINNMIRSGERNKRALSMAMDEAIESPSKRVRLGETGATSMLRRLQNMNTERKVANGDV